MHWIFVNANMKVCNPAFYYLRVCNHVMNNHPVRLSLSAVVQRFSLTTKQPQPAYKPQKQPTEQGEWISTRWYFETPKSRKLLKRYCISNLPDDSIHLDRTLLSHASLPCKKEFQNKAYQARKSTYQTFTILYNYRIASAGHNFSYIC
jgi:hypothetical protein